MNKIQKSLLIIFLTGILSSCEIQEPISSAPPVNNTTYQVEYLFEHEGCKVYRFLDRGNYVYFTNCTGDVTAVRNDSISTRVSNHIKVE